MVTLYDFPLSGNCYKPRLLLHQLQIPHKLTFVDRVNGATRTPEYLAKNPNGKIPLLELESGELLPESNAILWYLAEGSTLAPKTPLERAQTLQWLFFEQSSHMPHIGLARYWITIIKNEKEFTERLVEKHKLGNGALAVMEQHLSTRTFFVGERYGIADISLFAYTHVAEEGKFDLSLYPAVRAWLARVKSQPRFIALQ